MIGLDADWDRDLSDEVGFSSDVGRSRAGSSVRLRPSYGFGGASGSQLTASSSSSKAKELLRRASEAATASAALPRSAELSVIAPAGDMVVDCGAGVGELSSLVPAKAAIVDAAADASMDVDTALQDSPSKSFGILGCTELPRGSNASVARCTNKAPRTMGRGFSVRASCRGGLLAVPVVQSESGGSFRVKLLRIKPELLRHSTSKDAAAEESSDGVNLLETHEDIGFATSDATATPALGSMMRTPQAIVPSIEQGPALLAQYLEKGSACLGSHACEAFELLSSLLGDTPEESSGAAATIGSASHRFGVWLSQVNARTVKRHLEGVAGGAGISGQARSSLELGTPEGDDVGQRLKATFHFLTANSVRGALQELGRASASAAGDDTRHGHFDRLSTILASCGGTARGGCVERRQWLRRQVLEWRSQGVDELMGSSLWRVYCTLAGEVDNVASDALDWRTTFGLYLWYRSADEKNEGLVGAVRDFEEICRKHGTNCRFRPAPPHLLAHTSRKSPTGDLSLPALGSSSSSTDGDASCDAEPYDLQFSAVRAALGLVEWSDFKQFDYTTYSSRPMDVAGAWHFCLLLLSLSRPVSKSYVTSKAFQQLTQQYCLTLELSGKWEWAVYVARFISDDISRAATIRGLLQRHSSSSSSSGLALPARPHWSGIPASWIWHGEALRREKLWDWPGAVVCWLQSIAKADGSGGPEVERAIAALLGFLLIPAILRHRLTSPLSGGAAASFALGPVELEAASLAPMTAPAKWLLSSLSAVEPQLIRSEETWAWVGRDAIVFLREWERSGTTSYPPARLAQLCKRCSTTKQRVLGIPW